MEKNQTEPVVYDYGTEKILVTYNNNSWTMRREANHYDRGEVFGNIIVRWTVIAFVMVIIGFIVGDLLGRIIILVGGLGSFAMPFILINREEKGHYDKPDNPMVTDEATFVFGSKNENENLGDIVIENVEDIYRIRSLYEKNLLNLTYNTPLTMTDTVDDSIFSKIKDDYQQNSANKPSASISSTLVVTTANGKIYPVVPYRSEYKTDRDPATKIAQDLLKRYPNLESEVKAPKERKVNNETIITHVSLYTV